MGKPSRRRNFYLRLATGLPAFLGVLALIGWGPPLMVSILVGVLSVLATHEFRRLIAVGGGVEMPLIPLLTGAVLIALGGAWREPVWLNGGLALGVLIYLWAVWFRGEGGAGEEGAANDLHRAVYGLAALVWVPWLLNHASLVLTFKQGGGLLAFLVVVVTASDSWAYLGGNAYGKRKLMPSVSPKKTVEGSLTGLAGGATAGLVAGSWLETSFTPLAGFLHWELMLVGIAFAAISQAGDLLESKLKRLVKADDSGVVGLPGHGGVLDRADGYLVAAPLFYYFCVLTVPW